MLLQWWFDLVNHLLHQLFTSYDHDECHVVDQTSRANGYTIIIVVFIILQDLVSLLCKIDKTTSIRSWVTIKCIKDLNNNCSYLDKWYKEKKNLSIYIINFCKKNSFKCIKIDACTEKLKDFVYYNFVYFFANHIPYNDYNKYTKGYIWKKKMTIFSIIIFFIYNFQLVK